MKLTLSLLAALFVGQLQAGTVDKRQSTSFTSTGNPILYDGSIYSADPAPLVVDNRLYILSGRDEAGATTNNFVMNEWMLFETTNPNPAGGQWRLQRNVARPELFSWATSGSAYASQIVRGIDGRYYLYAPVQQRNGAADAFSIGVAVSSSPTGPFTDAHPSGPIISQRVPVSNNIHNIDPTVYVDTAANRVFLYWGSFNNLRGIELATDMVTTKGSIVTVNTLTGFFEAPWLTKRGSTYYLLYAANNAGSGSPCSPTSYHACIAYGTASNPLGPWTFRSVILDIVSSTTSHPGLVQQGNNWWFTYHTADAVNGGHFRRSIAFDQATWDDSTSPPSIRKIQPTWRSELTAPRPPSRNIAPLATATSANGTPVQYWIAALNDERVLQNPLPPDYWSSWADTRSPAVNTLTYKWPSQQQLNGVAIAFFTDQPAGSNVGVPPPASWRIEYLTSSGSWQAVAVTSSGGYPTPPSRTPPEVRFNAITTTSIRAILNASGGNGRYGAVGIHEWYAYAPNPV
nr:hypothetical protein [Paramyrothecium sp.]